MSTSFTALIVALSTPAVALLIFLFKRRAILRAMDATTDATRITASGEMIKQLQGQVDILYDRVQVVETGRANDVAKLTAQLTRAHTENERCAGNIASLRTDLDIAERQIGELRQRLTG